ncbi:MAG: DUF885 domain-containing protein [Myxococcales bacterium]|nr:DUF885 domain-containing protein [Myxococcales bacterium]
MWKVLLTLALASLPGCPGSRPPPPPPSAPDAARAPGANERLDALVRDHVDGLVIASPTTATWLGLHAGDERLDDTGPDAQAREAARLRALLAAARDLPEEELDELHRVDRILLEREARLGLLDFADPRPLEKNPLRYADLAAAGLDELVAREFAPLPDRIRALDARLLRLRALFDDARRNLKNPPELFTRRAIELCQGTRGFLAEPLLKAVMAIGDEKLLAEFRAAQAEGLRVLDEFIAWMQRDLLPRSKGDLALGKERLLERLRIAEGIDLPFDQLLALAERELRQARLRYEEAAHATAPGKSPVEAPRVLEDDHPTAETLLPAASAALDQAATFVREHHLATLPQGAPAVAEMPAYQWGFIALTGPGPLEARAREWRYHVDPVDRSWNKKRREEHLRALNRPQLQLSAIHEAFPGHFLQAEAARHAPSTMQRLARSYAFSEGWAHYAEEMMLDEGFGDPKLRLAQLREALVRACRFVAALRLHGSGTKVDDLVEVFTDEGYLDDYSARREAERAAYDPMYLGHALGRLAILKLREDVRSARGDAFSLGVFHDQLLAHGALPVPVLRRILLPGDTGRAL